MLTEISKNEIQLLKPNELTKLSISDLKNELAKTLQLTVEYIKYLALIWRELENRGADLSDLRHGIFNYLRLVANELAEPNLIVKYAGHRSLLNTITRLPLKVQKLLCEKNEIELAQIDENQNELIIKKKLEDLRPRELYLAFGDYEIRPIEQQFTILKARNEYKKSQNQPRVPEAQELKIDRSKNLLYVRRRNDEIAVDIDRLLDQLSEYFNIDLKNFLSKSQKI